MLPVKQLFGMLEYAYDLFEVRKGVAEIEDTQDIFESLADILSRRIFTRVTQGLYREYIEREEVLPYLRGRIIVGNSLRD